MKAAPWLRRTGGETGQRRGGLVQEIKRVRLLVNRNGALGEGRHWFHLGDLAHSSRSKDTPGAEG